MEVVFVLLVLYNVPVYLSLFQCFGHKLGKTWSLDQSTQFPSVGHNFGLMVTVNLEPCPETVFVCSS